MDNNRRGQVFEGIVDRLDKGIVLKILADDLNFLMREQYNRGYEDAEVMHNIKGDKNG